MMDPRESDIGDEQLDLVDISNNFDDSSLLAFPKNDSQVNEQQQQTSTSLTESKSGGFCVKDYEMRLSKLTKENFNLKLRLYFLEEKNPNIPQGAEALYKENIDLKVSQLE